MLSKDAAPPPDDTAPAASLPVAGFTLPARVAQLEAGGVSGGGQRGRLHHRRLASELQPAHQRYTRDSTAVPMTHLANSTGSRTLHVAPNSERNSDGEVKEAARSELASSPDLAHASIPSHALDTPHDESGPSAAAAAPTLGLEQNGKLHPLAQTLLQSSMEPSLPLLSADEHPPASNHPAPVAASDSLLSLPVPAHGPRHSMPRCPAWPWHRPRHAASFHRPRRRRRRRHGARRGG
jgi:hypothetical protein